ncbi:NACHT, LRR and PYD domains-containing protein 3-like [Chanos chanos]|uniref:NACHT, LRR and PYD domains-containing protein 3-like n=1 Tax=Chanos chanos TaxID=29144 RepID=A0A6J2VBE5_CHACN|nr:NACHT, LRR and PYD domains-containing protein 3-like [Chanos chanos]
MTGEPVRNLTSVSLKYKELVRSEYAYVTEYNSLPGEHVLLTDRYTELLIIQRHREQTEREEEIRSRGEKFFSARDSEKYINITVEQFFSPDDHGLIPKAVVLQGNSGNGKSFTAQKIMLDWASGTVYAENFNFIFHLKCKEINQISEVKSLVELLRYSQSLTPAQISQILQHSPERVLFLIDGFDELKLSQDNMSNLSPPLDVQTPASPESTLKALLSGRLLPESFLLVTTRSTATDTLSKLLKKQPQRFTEIMGFSERGVEEYFQRFFKDDQLLQTQAYELVKANETLFTASFIPVICWIICTVFRERHNDGKNSVHDLETTTSIYVDFVSILLEHHCQGLSQSVPSLLRSLGQLAERGMLEQQVLFDKKSVSETVSDPANIPFLCKFLFRRKIRQETMFSFMHLSFQEFFTALYYVLMSKEESQMKVKDLLRPLKTSGYQNYISTEKLPLLPVIQFLCGLFNKDVSSSLMESQSLSVSVTIQDQIKEWILNFLMKRDMSRAWHMRMFILHCLYELHEEDFVRKAMDRWENVDLSGSSMRRTDCWVLQYCLQFSPPTTSLNLSRCSITAEKLKILQPAVCRSQTLVLGVEDLSDDDVGVLISALGEGKDLSCLSVENSALSDQGIQQVFDALSKQKSLGAVNFMVKTITTNTVVMITNFIHNKDIKKGIRLTVEDDRKMFRFSEISSPLTEPPLPGISLACPHSEISNIDWTTFSQIISEIKDTQQISTGFDEQLDALLSFLCSVPGLKKVYLTVRSLTDYWVSGTLCLMETCPSLIHVIVEVIDGDFRRRCTKPTDQCSEPKDWTHSCNQGVKLQFGGESSPYPDK